MQSRADSNIDVPLARKMLAQIASSNPTAAGFLKRFPRSSSQSQSHAFASLLAGGQERMLELWGGEFRRCLAEAAGVPGVVSQAQCNFCGVSSDALRSCARCKQAQYCSRECQLEDWKDGHKQQCGKAQAQGSCGNSKAQGGHTTPCENSKKGKPNGCTQWPTKAMLEQLQLQRDNPAGDWILVQDHMDALMQVSNPMGQMFFKTLKKKALETGARNMFLFCFSVSFC